MMNVENYIVYLDSFARLKFFWSLKLVKENLDRTTFITIHPGVDGLLKMRGFRTVLITKNKGRSKHENEQLNNIGKLELKLGWSEDEVKSYFNQVDSALTGIKQGDMLFLVWNSGFIFGQIVKQKYPKSQVIYFENSNFKGNAYASFSGTNADLKLDRMLEVKEVSNLFLPQQWLVVTTKEKILLIIRQLFSSKMKYYRYKKPNKLNILSNKIFWPLVSKLLSTNKLQGGYIFIPMQIAYDSNVLFYYEGTIQSFMESCIKDFKNKRMILKFHPKDNNFFFKLVLLWRYWGKIEIADLPSEQLIENADLVATINSTVGFEAILKEKQVKCYGNSYYSSIGVTTAHKYLEKYQTGLKF